MNLHLICARIALPSLLFLAVLSSNAQEYALPDLKFLGGSSFGRKCGIAGVDPSERVRTERIVHLMDTKAAMVMLFDVDPVLQTYGAEAVIRLQRLGAVFSKRALDKVEELRQSKKEITVCSGCSTWTMPIDEALKGGSSVNEL